MSTYTAKHRRYAASRKGRQADRRYKRTAAGLASEARYKAKHVPARMMKRRQFIDKIKVDRGCADCGYNAHPAALHFDHLPGEIKCFNVGNMLHRSEEAILAEVAKCEVVCANCHSVRTFNRRRVCSHIPPPAIAAPQQTPYSV